MQARINELLYGYTSHTLYGCSGQTTPGIATRFRPEYFARTDNERRRLWEQVRDQLVAEFIEAHPGCRPWAWWRFDAPPERRRRIRPADAMTPANFDWALAKGCGLPSEHHSVVIVDADFETQAEYLRRHNLLTSAEIELLTPQPA